MGLGIFEVWELDDVMVLDIGFAEAAFDAAEPPHDISKGKVAQEMNSLIEKWRSLQSLQLSLNSS